MTNGLGHIYIYIYFKLLYVPVVTVYPFFGGHACRTHFWGDRKEEKVQAHQKKYKAVNALLAQTRSAVVSLHLRRFLSTHTSQMLQIISVRFHEYREYRIASVGCLPSYLICISCGK